MPEGSHVKLHLLSFIGGPAAGKSKQSELTQGVNCSHPIVDWGEVFRARAKAGNLRDVDSMLNGGLVSDTDALAVFFNNVPIRPDHQTRRTIVGFPRTLVQVEPIIALTSGRSPCASIDVVYLDINFEQAFKRTGSRGREDDKKFQNRWGVHKTNSPRVLELLRLRSNNFLRVHEVDGMGSPEEVQSRIREILIKCSSGFRGIFSVENSEKLQQVA